MKPDRSQLISLILIVSLLLTGSVRPTSAQSRPVVITFGQPNIWSLEQAHYLLNRLHRQNLDLQIAPLDALDPNDANASRIDILKTLLSAGVTFDQAVGVNNELLRRDREFNSDRRRQLLENRSSLQAESTQLARDISSLRIAKANATSDAEKAQIQTSIDAKTEEKAAVDNQLTQTNDELKGLTSSTGDFKSATVPDMKPSTLQGDLDNLIDKVQFVNPSLAATLRLDNHIQLQYEIISKQLTLLRDEVGPGERLVFLELPQSINATQDRAEGKMAQTWWRIAGYTTVDEDKRLEDELRQLRQKIDEIERLIKDLDANYAETKDQTQRENQEAKAPLEKQLAELCREQALREAELAQKQKELDSATEARNDELCASLKRDLDALEDSIDQLERVIKGTRRAIQKVDDQQTKLNYERVRLSQTFTSLSAKYEKLRVEQIRNRIRRQNDIADRLIQGGSARTTEIVKGTINAMGFQKDTRTDAEQCEEVQGSGSRQFINLENCNYRTKSEGSSTSADLQVRSVRTIDIIPRQNAVNVQDTKQRLSRTGIFAALSFLFGFAGKFTYERQREQAEQFLNQELFTSGFGKGEKDFGWSFYPYAGTKQLSSGVRTTFAVAIIPERAETIVLKARGCYFPRKENQPDNYDMAARGNWVDEDRRSRAQCSQEESAFVLPVPGGSGDGADFYVTDFRYNPNQPPGSRMIATIRGKNLPSQLGILINGVPLRQAIGLGQLNIESVLGHDKTRDNCVKDICGRFERIDDNEVVISFEMGPDFETTPRIELIGPGKAVEINGLYLTINSVEDAQLKDSPFMFGFPPDPTLRRITDFKVTPPPPGSTRMTGVLTGSKFKLTDSIFINGSLATPVTTHIPATATTPATSVKECRNDLCIVTFERQETDFLTVTIKPLDGKERAVSKTFVNPTNLSIISSSVVKYTAKEGTNPDVMTVKLDGSGFKESLAVRIVKSAGPPDIPQKIVPSSGQMFLKITSPEAVVQIEVQDPANNRVVNAVVVRP